MRKTTDSVVPTVTTTLKEESIDREERLYNVGPTNRRVDGLKMRRRTRNSRVCVCFLFGSVKMYGNVKCSTKVYKLEWISRDNVILLL